MRPSIEAWTKSDITPVHPLYEGNDALVATEFGVNAANADGAKLEPHLLPAPESLIVGLDGIVSHRKAKNGGGFYAGSGDSISFRASDYQDVNAFHRALADDLGLTVRRGEKHHEPVAQLFETSNPAQFTHLISEVWRRAHVAQRVYRQGHPSISTSVVVERSGYVSHMTTMSFSTDGKATSCADGVTPGAVETAVIEVDLSTKNPTQLGPLLDGAMKGAWEKNVNDAIEAVLRDFMVEAGLDSFGWTNRLQWGSDVVKPGVAVLDVTDDHIWGSRDVTKLLPAMKDWFEHSASVKRLSLGWRHGYRIAEAGAVIKEAYAQVDREALTFSAQLSSTLTQALYLEVVRTKTECLEAVSNHGGLAPAYMPSKLLTMINSEGMRSRGLEESAAQFCEGFRSVISDGSRDFFRPVAIRNVGVLMSRAVMSLGDDEEQNVAQGRQTAEFLNFCTEDRLVPAHTLLAFADLGKFIHGEHVQGGHAQGERKRSGPADAFAMAKALSKLSGKGRSMSALSLSMINSPNDVVGESANSIAKFLELAGRGRTTPNIMEGRAVMGIAKTLGPMVVKSEAGKVTGSLVLKGVKPAPIYAHPTDANEPGNALGMGGLVFEYTPSKPERTPRGAKTSASGGPDGSRPESHLVFWPVAAGGEPTTILEADDPRVTRNFERLHAMGIAASIPAPQMSLISVTALRASVKGFEKRPLNDVSKHIEASFGSQCAGATKSLRYEIAPVIEQAVAGLLRKQPVLSAALFDIGTEEMMATAAQSKIRSPASLTPILNVAIRNSSSNGVRAVLSAISDPLYVNPRAKTLLDMVVERGFPAMVKAALQTIEQRLGGPVPGAYLSTALETALDSQNPGMLTSILAAEPELTQEQYRRTLGWHHGLRTQEVITGADAGLMRHGIRASLREHEASHLASAGSSNEAGAVSAPPISRRRTVSL